MKSSELSEALLRDICNLFDNADDYNVSIQVGEEPDIEVFRTHSVILRARSSYFRAALSSNWAKKKGDFITYKKPNITPKVFKDILKYIYTGSINLENNKSQEELLDLLIAADELALDELVEYIQDHIIQNEEEWLRRNIIQIYQTSTKYKACGILKTYCEKIICKNASSIFQYHEFASLEESCLISLLKNDELQLQEIQVWDYVIKWALAQNPSINSDTTKWTSEDVSAMEKTLQECIPHIRFHQIKASDYYHKVRPYKKLLPRDLKEDLKLSYLVPESEAKYLRLPPRNPVRLQESSIITAEHAALISSWIDRKESTYELINIPYEFKLISRGSRDGKTRQAFKDRCDKQGPTVTIIKTKGTEQLIGGYNPKQWNSSGQWLVTKDSFIFSLGTGRDLQNEPILSRVANPEQAIRDCAPIYDCVGFGCGDLHIIEGSCVRKDYEREIINSTTFTIEDFEVFKIIKIH
ncbi:hypothetical protein Glove_166g11 [Diversispora epigaea]|uniref:BTB domain-containing protein n=1 Tax=Diversispora epigaea TaxID=1348612 RepID=A0A397ITK1_9GLOM|nr:hypothetical protein Glove_166g11 [Diversispora epigaea]